jgi:predicted metalloprotease with PDZ domain
MKRLCILFFIALPLSLLAQQIQYEFNAPNAEHHEAEITVRANGLKQGPVIFRMSRSSPGRYATHEFGKNVYNVSATDGNGKQLTVEKIDAEVYRIKNHPGSINLSYILYGNYADGTYASIDASGYHLNIPASFMWIKGLEKAPISITFKAIKKDWKVATQLKPTNQPYTFTAPDLQYFMDAPIKVGDLHIREWTVSNPDQKQYTIRLALEANATEALVDSFTTKLQKVVGEAKAVFGELPAFDYGTYTFIASLNPYVKGDGMEHRNSTMITSGREFTGNNNFLNTFAHEFIHAWNVERIRPQSLEPFNFEKSNMSEGLWIAEGFTQYYGLLLMKRAGLMSDADFNLQLAGLINGKENTPGGIHYTPIENSQRAVFVDAGVAVDRTNYPNMFISYYTHGAALALALDLHLRNQFGKTLDGFMQQLWKAFGKPEKPYTIPQVQQLLASYTTPTFANDFFKKHVYGHESINYKELLIPTGLEVKKSSIGKAWIGNVRFTDDSTQLIVANNTIKNTPLYKAGVDIDDVLLQIGNKKLYQPKDVGAALAEFQPGQSTKIIYKHRNTIIERDLTLEESPFYTVVPIDGATDKQKTLLQDWVSPKMK